MFGPNNAQRYRIWSQSWSGKQTKGAQIFSASQYIMMKWDLKKSWICSIWIPNLTSQETQVGSGGHIENDISNIDNFLNI